MAEPNKKNSKLILCYHCGNTTLMENVASHYSEWSDDENGIWDRYTWNLYFCPVCSKVTLEEVELFSEWCDYQGNLEPKVKFLYPMITSNDKMPKSVRNAFDAALKVRNIDGAICALSLRRTLEMMCKDKGATKGDLFAKLKSLSEQGVLPPILDRMASILRHLGNSAAHADSTSFSEDLVMSMVEFTEIILDYVYVLPAKMNDIQGVIEDKSKQPEKNVG